MKIRILLGLVMALNGLDALASECKLERPIPFSGSILRERYLSQVITDVAPKFLRPENYEHGSDRLAMVLFEMSDNGRPAGLLGAKLGMANGGEYVGFSNQYSGSTAMEGEIEESEGVRTYWSRVSVTYGDSGGIPAIHELRVGVRGSEIVSLQLIHPVFEVTGSDGPYTYIRFTGENQRLCIRKAR